MTYDVFRMIFMISAIAAGAFFGISILLFFVLRIPEVISYLTGKTRQKGIEEIIKSGKSNAAVKRQEKEENSVSVPSQNNGTKQNALQIDDLSKQGADTVELPTAELQPGISNMHGDAKVFAIEYEITYIHTEEQI
ncbi:MAG: hypothetical protein IJV50_01690 [Lachnospiraceae bacterium]|nr:hypothetical protein [Lachnospiraceae bacterium]